MTSITSEKLGHCIVCGKRVQSDEDYVKSTEGYCCKDCVMREERMMMA